MAYLWLNFALLFAGIYKHVAFGIVGYLAAQKLESFNNEKLRERIIVLEDYVQRHPEDFAEEGMFLLLINLIRQWCRDI